MSAAMPYTLPDVPSFLSQEVDRQSLRYAAGRTLWCPSCRSVLDCRTTVEVEQWRMAPPPSQAALPGIPADNTGPQLHATTILCAACYDKVADDIPQLIGDMGAGRGVEYGYRVIDGRTLWAPARKPAPRKRNASK